MTIRNLLLFGGMLLAFMACNNIESLEENAQQSKENTLLEGELGEKKLKVKPHWKEVSVVQGSTSIETDPFKIKGKEWQIKWELKPQSKKKASEFILILYDRNDPAYTEVVANAEGAENDFVFLEGKGEYYLSVNAKNTQYRITIEELKY